ncbi:uncharacterized protein [Diadema antillarum]|uniref:uncharacterized protein n=1 Tax=Diadema antillarum TaxID=105358 RepID=UPI003A8B8AE5
MEQSSFLCLLLTCYSMTSMVLSLSFRNQPDTVSAYAGDTIYMRCDLYLDAGDQPSTLRVTWKKVDSRNTLKDISILGHIVLANADPERFSIVGDPRMGEHDLKIQDVQYEDAGMYFCQVTASGRFLESAAGRLTVHVPIPIPTCEINPPIPTVGQRVTFVCAQQMHPQVNYEALNWWNETSRSKIVTQGRYSDGSIYFTRLLLDSDRNQKFVCSQGQTYVPGSRNCSIIPLPAIEISTIANPLTHTIFINPAIKNVTERSSATFGCRSSAGPVSRWVFGYGSRASKIRETRNRFLVSADKSELTVIRTTLNDSNSVVRCIVVTDAGEKLTARSVLYVLPSNTQPDVTDPKIAPPLPPVYTARPAATDRSTRGQTTRRTVTPGTKNEDKTGIAGTNVPDGKTFVNVQNTPYKLTTPSGKVIEPTTRRDAAQIEADTGADATTASDKDNDINVSILRNGGGLGGINTHEVSSNSNPEKNDNNSGIAGAIIGSLLIIALVVLLIFLIKTKRYPKTVPSWIPPSLVAALKRPRKKSDRESFNNSESAASGKASMRLKEIEVVVNPPPPEWQFRLKDVENTGGRAEHPSNTPKNHMNDGPVYANLSPGLSKAHVDEDVHDEDEDDSLFSSDFDDELDLEGEIVAEIAARSGDECREAGLSEKIVEERKSRNVEGLVYAQLDLGPDAEKRSTVYIEGEKTQYAHIQHGESTTRK